MTIEETHRENFKLIVEHKIKKGSVFVLTESFLNFAKGEEFKVYTINPYYGWICFETSQLPQEASKLLKIGYFRPSQSVFKIIASSSLKQQIESQRAYSGSMHSYVIRWDTLLNQEWDTKDQLLAYIENILTASDKSLIEIREVFK